MWPYHRSPFPHYPQLIYTGGGTKSAVMRMLVERLLYDGGKGPLINAEALSNDKVGQLSNVLTHRSTHALTQPQHHNDTNSSTWT